VPAGNEVAVAKVTGVLLLMSLIGWLEPFQSSAV
jgi:hypothetical protein